MPVIAAVVEGDDVIDLIVDDEDGETEFPDIVSALGVELEEQPVEAEPDETDHSEE